MTRVLVTRPEPGASRTAKALTSAGFEPIVHPLMSTEALEWDLPEAEFDAVMLTSAAAARHAGDRAARLKALPVLCVGEACAAAARAEGFMRAEAVGRDVSEVLVVAAGFRHILHLAGEDRTAAQVPDGLRVTLREVYRARLLPLGDIGNVDAVMLYSARSARHFVSQWASVGGGGDLAVVAMSKAVAAAAGDGWRQMLVAAAADEASMLAALVDAGL